MLFSAPLPFKEALQARAVRNLLPTSLSSDELAEIDAEILERAMFSARTVNAEYLQHIDDLIDQLVDGKIDPASVRLSLKEKLDEIGYKPSPDDEGTIKDLGNDSRLNLVIKMNTQMAQGYGQWQQGQDPVILDQWPCQELYRAMGRKEPRDWISRWEDAGGEFFDGGRMIARKDSDIWTRISAFGTPYPPFDFNSGMDVRSVDRDEARKFGIIDRDTQVQPQGRGFNQDLKASPGVRAGWLRDSLESNGYQFDGDTLTLGGSEE